MLHSGSRNVGNETARIHVRNAKAIMKAQQIKLADPDLAFLTVGTPEFADYLEDLRWCQQYAYKNRQVMLRLVLDALGVEVDPKTVINCHHNYAEVENHFDKDVLVVRKGAVRARQGDLGIIPGSMGQKSYIVKGLGNPESFCSCSHGAGRAHSRTKAKELFTEADLEKQTEGVFCRKDRGVLDEIPSAYKNLDVVMDNQKDLIEIVETLKSVVCVKG
jgi:tRNA-splicing ligase RtcB